MVAPHGIKDLTTSNKDKTKLVFVFLFLKKNGVYTVVNYDVIARSTRHVCLVLFCDRVDELKPLTSIKSCTHLAKNILRTANART